MTTTTSARWSPHELDRVRSTLTTSLDALQCELAGIRSEMTELGEETCSDDADFAERRLEMRHDEVQAGNAHAIVVQLEHVLDRLDAGLYGVCELCAQPIPENRMKAFPRATTCIACTST